MTYVSRSHAPYILGVEKTETRSSPSRGCRWKARAGTGTRRSTLSARLGLQYQNRSTGLLGPCWDRPCGRPTSGLERKTNMKKTRKKTAGNSGERRTIEKHTIKNSKPRDTKNAKKEKKRKKTKRNLKTTETKKKEKKNGDKKQLLRQPSQEKTGIKSNFSGNLPSVCHIHSCVV